MKVGFSNRNFDTVMVMDAILISLACVLIILAYREITQAPIRHARDLAHAVLTVTDDFSTDDALSSSAFDENGTVQLEKRFQDTLVQIRAFEPGANVQLYSDHPLLVPLSVPADSFLSNALEGFRAAEANVVEANAFGSDDAACGAAFGL